MTVTPITNFVWKIAPNRKKAFSAAENRERSLKRHICQMQSKTNTSSIKGKIPVEKQNTLRASRGGGAKKRIRQA